MTWSQQELDDFFIKRKGFAQSGSFGMWYAEFDIYHKYPKEVPKYVVMKDIVTYIPPFGFLGTIANYFLIKKKLKYIFDYRFNIMDKMFNK